MKTDTVNRRTILLATGAAAVLAIPVGAWAHPQEAASGVQTLGAEVVDLWPAAAPGTPSRLPAFKAENGSNDPGRPGRWLTGVDRPALVVYRPAKPNGGAVLVIPGGGYYGEAYDHEGVRQAEWLTANGITAFILVYRLPLDGWDRRSVVPLQDAQRAMRVIRSRAADYRIDPERVATLGFSAGGHLAGSLLTRSAQQVYTAVDETDGLSATPLFAGLIYPVVTMEPGTTHAGSREALIGADADAAATRAASVDANVSPQTPPAFIVHATDDDVVPVANATLMYEAMRSADRPVALHIFERGGHGFGASLPVTEPAYRWPQLFLSFARDHGLY